MDTRTKNNHNNPNNWNGTNPVCSECETELNCFFDFENLCTNCHESEEETEYKYQITKTKKNFNITFKL